MSVLRLISGVGSFTGCAIGIRHMGCVAWLAAARDDSINRCLWRYATVDEVLASVIRLVFRYIIICFSGPPSARITYAVRRYAVCPCQVCLLQLLLLLHHVSPTIRLECHQNNRKPAPPGSGEAGLSHSPTPGQANLTRPSGQLFGLLVLLKKRYKHS